MFIHAESGLSELTPDMAKASLLVNFPDNLQTAFS